jgi:hypothetical protein
MTTDDDYSGLNPKLKAIARASKVPPLTISDLQGPEAALIDKIDSKGIKTAFGVIGTRVAFKPRLQLVSVKKASEEARSAIHDTCHGSDGGESN